MIYYNNPNPNPNLQYLNDPSQIDDLDYELCDTAGDISKTISIAVAILADLMTFNKIEGKNRSTARSNLIYFILTPLRHDLMSNVQIGLSPVKSNLI